MTINQYRKNYLSPQIIEHTKKRHILLEIQVLACDRHRNVAVCHCYEMVKQTYLLSLSKMQLMNRPDQFNTKVSYSRGYPLQTVLALSKNNLEMHSSFLHILQ